MLARLVPEEILTQFTNLSGQTEDEAKRADMIYFKIPSGGQAFAVGSITFCGSLPWNNFKFLFFLRTSSESLLQQLVTSLTVTHD